MYDRHYFQFCLMFDECWLWQHFSESVYELFLCKYLFYAYVVILDQLPNVVMLDIYVFHSFVVLSVLNKVQAGLVITQNLYERWQLVHR